MQRIYHTVRNAVVETTTELYYQVVMTAFQYQRNKQRRSPRTSRVEAVWQTVQTSYWKVVETWKHQQQKLVAKVQAKTDAKERVSLMT